MSKDILDEILLRRLVLQSVKYDMDNALDKTRKDFEKELAEMEDAERVELFDDEFIVHEEFEEGGRWSNYETKVYRVYHEGFKYIQVTREVPATEAQEVDSDPEYMLVYPHKVETTVYKSTPVEGE